MKHLLALTTILLLMTFSTQLAVAQPKAMTADTHAKAKASIDAVYAAFNSGNLDELDKYIDANYIEHSPDPGQKPGLAGLKESMKQFRTAFPDLHFTSEKIIVDGNMMCGVFRLTGTNKGPMMGMPATGKKIDIMGTDVVKIGANNKGIEHWAFMEESKMMTQLGLMPGMDMPTNKK